MNFTLFELRVIANYLKDSLSVTGRSAFAKVLAEIDRLESEPEPPEPKLGPFGYPLPGQLPDEAV